MPFLLQLTLIELEFLRAIDVHELVVFTWDPNTAGRVLYILITNTTYHIICHFNAENKPYRRNLDAFIERFNKVSNAHHHNSTIVSA